MRNGGPDFEGGSQELHAPPSAKSTRRLNWGQRHPWMRDVVGIFSGFTGTSIAEGLHVVPSLDVNWINILGNHFPGDLTQLAGGIIGMIAAYALSEGLSRRRNSAS